VRWLRGRVDREVGFLVGGELVPAGGRASGLTLLKATVHSKQDQVFVQIDHAVLVADGRRAPEVGGTIEEGYLFKLFICQLLDQREIIEERVYFDSYRSRGDIPGVVVCFIYAEELRLENPREAHIGLQAVPEIIPIN